MTQVVKLLKDARNLIAKRENWTQDDYAKTADGNGVYSKSDEAVCWCSLGALTKLSPTDEDKQVRKLAKSLLREAMDSPIAIFNDSHTHEEVLAAWDKAIELAKAAEFKG